MREETMRASRSKGSAAAIAAVLWLSAAPVAVAERVQVRSPEVVKQLTAAMQARGLAAVAAKDPEEPDRYVAAMLFPGVQLLVITARTSSTAYVDAQLASRAYENAYTTLHQGTPDSKAFFQDMAADGLLGADGGTADIVYLRGVQQHVLNGDAKAAKLSRAAYAELVADLDERYTKLLRLLLQAAQAGTPPPAAGR
jgi:hypothetical protein